MEEDMLFPIERTTRWVLNGVSYRWAWCEGCGHHTFQQKVVGADRVYWRCEECSCENKYHGRQGV